VEESKVPGIFLKAFMAKFFGGSFGEVPAKSFPGSFGEVPAKFFGDSFWKVMANIFVDNFGESQLNFGGSFLKYLQCTNKYTNPTL
jgi:hypothetical protein